MLLSDLQKLLINRTAEPMRVAGMDITTYLTSNANLEEPIYSAYLTMTDLTTVPYPITDTELSNIVAPPAILQLVDVAYLYLLRTIVNTLTAVDERLGPHGIWASQYPARVQKMYEGQLAVINSKYGIELSTLQAGVLSFEVTSEIQ